MACWAAGLCALVMLPPLLLPPHFTAPAEAVPAPPVDRTRGPEVSQEPKCTAPSQVKNTQPFTQERFPSEVGTQLRYKCGKGYKRKAGTSSLIVCQSIDKTASWSPAKVECIPDPSLPSQPITSLPATPETKKDKKLPSETSTTPGSYPGSRSTSEADKNLGFPQIDTSTLPPRSPPASPKSTSTLIPLQDSPSVTTGLPERRPTVTASAKTTPIDRRETSTAEDTSRNSGSCCTSEADVMAPGILRTKCPTLLSADGTTAAEDTSPSRLPQPSSGGTVIEDRSSAVTAAPQNTQSSHTAQHDTSTVKDPSSNSGFSSEKHRMMLGVGIPAGVIIISVIVVFIIRKRRGQQQAPGPDTENHPMRMTPLPKTPTTGGESSSFLGEHNREHEKDGT